MKLQINYKKKTGNKMKKKKNECVNEEIRVNQKHPETNENENSTFQNLQDTAKTFVKGKFIAIETHLKK